MRWGLLSTANINGKLLAGARGTDEATVVAVASRDRGRAEEFAREHGIERAHGSYEALLEDPDVDAVYNPLPNSLHVPWSVRALEAGKHVLCEKPLTRRPAEVEEAFAAAERAGRVLEEAFMWRHHPQTHRLRELLDEGAVGPLRMVKASFSFPLDGVSDIRMQAGLDGGSLMDVGCYCVSGCRLVAGAEPERVSAEQVVGGDDVDVAFAATLRFPGDVIGAFHCGFAVGRRHHLEAIGEEGSLFLADPWHGRSPVIELRREDGVELIEIDDANPYTHELIDFARAVARRGVAAAGQGGRARPGARDRGALPLGGVRLGGGAVTADDGDRADEAGRRLVDLGDLQLDPERAAVGVEGGHLDRAAGQHGLAAGRDALHPARVRAAQRGRHDQLGHRAGDRVSGAVAEQLLGALVPPRDDALGVHPHVSGGLLRHAPHPNSSARKD